MPGVLKHVRKCEGMQLRKLLSSKSEGSIAGVIGGLITGVVMLFVGLFMISAVSNATKMHASDTFYATQTALVTTTGTIFSVLGLVIIVVALATALNSLRSVTGE
jgi:heme/copper-type cytochrome/quinol oxidase subunit 2